jgi:CrcB protein
MSFKARMLGYLFLGGALGSMARYVVFEAMQAGFTSPQAELFALSFVNLTGSWFLGLSARYPGLQSPWCRNLWGLGFAGGFTTMSGITLFVDSQGLSWPIALMLFAGLLSYGIGFRQGQWFSRRQAKA